MIRNRTLLSLLHAQQQERREFIRAITDLSDRLAYALERPWNVAPADLAEPFQLEDDEPADETVELDQEPDDLGVTW